MMLKDVSVMQVVLDDLKLLKYAIIGISDPRTGGIRYF